MNMQKIVTTLWHIKNVGIKTNPTEQSPFREAVIHSAEPLESNPHLPKVPF
jgi:hypothetical protein